ncbi:MAG: tetratricopeptide repeat protein [Chloroflexota bacterium]|nr:tetratricopeptide repeat protein [Chloroflexota bacterium]
MSATPDYQHQEPTIQPSPPLPPRVLRLGRPERMLLLALVVFVGALLVRLVKDRVAEPEMAPSPQPIEQASETHIIQLQEKLSRFPDNSYLYAQLGLALLQRVRETGDATLYRQAEEAFEEALARDPEQLDALLGEGILANARHEFEEALVWTERAWAINPYRAETLGIMVDAQVELGRYEQAVETLQRMVALRPDLASYSRVSYLRELHGDMPAAIEAMKQAVDVGMPGTESWLWAQAQLGHLYFNSGDLAQAEAIYQEALRLDEAYPYALAGMARVRAARGQYNEAIATYRAIVERLPLPEFIIALGELYEATGQQREATLQYDLVRAMQQLNADAGMNVDLELALFNADHGSNPEEAVAQARAAYERRPNIYAADALAWALYQVGDYSEASRYSNEALRLGTQDASLHYHAGKIAYALGDRAAARTHLAQALEINPYFSPLHALDARDLLQINLSSESQEGTLTSQQLVSQGH